MSTHDSLFEGLEMYRFIIFQNEFWKYISKYFYIIIYFWDYIDVCDNYYYNPHFKWRNWGTES